MLNFLLVAVVYLLIGLVLLLVRLFQDLRYVQDGGFLGYGGDEYILTLILWPWIAMVELSALPFRLRDWLKKKGN